MSLIKKAIDLVDGAVKQLLKYQKGEDAPIKTRFWHLNNNSLGGIFKSMIITIAGISGGGKSYLLQQIEEDIFDKKLNPDCDSYILLRCNWEMTVFKLLMRKLKRSLNKSMKHLLFTEVEGEDIGKFKEVCDSERSGQIFYLEDPTDPKTWYETVQEFLEANKDKKQIVITIDHLALVRDLFGSKKKAMDDLVEYINSLKKEYTNVSFILLSQMNRDIEGRTDVRHLAPKRSDLYNTDTLFQISDLVIVVHNPYKLGHEKYMVVSPARYPYLIEHMDKPSNKRTNFDTYNKIFWHYLKIREIEDMEDINDIYIEQLNSNLKPKGEEEKTLFNHSIEDESDNRLSYKKNNQLSNNFLEDNEE